MFHARLRSLLLRFIEAGDARAMEEFVEATRSRLLKVARRIGAPQDADDSVQAAFHALLQRGSNLPSGPLFPWLMVATVRIAYRRKALQGRELDLGERLAVASGERGPLESAAQSEELRLVRDAVTKLPPRYRDVIVLHYLEGLTAAEAGRLLEVSRSTVTTRLRRARRLLRSRLPRLAYGILLLPWLAADGWAAIPAPTGTFAQGGGLTMAWKAKTAVLVGLVAAGGAGVAIGQASEHGVAGAVGEARSTHVARLQHEVEELRALNRTLRAQLEEPARQLPVARGQDAQADPLGSESSAGFTIDVPRSVRDAATGLGVRETMVEAAWRFTQTTSSEEKAIRWKQLADGGREGFLAFSTLLYGGKSGTHLRARFAELWRPEYEGAEQALIDFIETEERYGYAKWTAYSALGFMDTPASRDFLVKRAEIEQDAGYYMSMATSLGALREARAYEELARRLSKLKWHRNVRSSIMAALVRIDQNRATTTLIEYVRAPESDLLRSALAHLESIDPVLAKREARALLDGPRAGLLDKATHGHLRRLVGAN